MSSGLQINSAQDDAANFGISERMKANLNARAVLKDNASTGVSMMQTLDGDLEQISNMLQRMRELTVQGLNGVYSDSEKDMIMKEVEQIGKEIKRVTEASSFADKKLLDSNSANFDPLKIYVDDKGQENYIDLTSVSKNLLFADVLSKEKDIYMMPMTSGQTSFVEFNNKLYQIDNTSTETRNLIYGYEEDLGNEDNSVTLVEDTQGIDTSFVAAYQNDYVQMGNGEMYLTIPGGQTSMVTVGGNVFSLANSDGAEQTVVFETSGTSINIASGQNVSGNFEFALSGYNTAVGNETAISLNGSQSKYVNYAGDLYRLTNNSASQETLVYRNVASNLQALSGNVSSTFIGNISTATSLDATNKYVKLSANQELFYENSGQVYSLKNNTAQAQMLVLDSSNNIVNPSASVTRTNMSAISGSTGMANPYKIDAVAGQTYYVRSDDGTRIHELTASATGTLLVDFNGTNILSVGGVGATENTIANPRFENVTPDGMNQFTLDLSPGSQEGITIGNEVYKITNAGGPKNNISFTYDSLTKTIALDVPNGQITVDGYQGDLANKTALGANDYYVSGLAAGASAFFTAGGDIFKITNSSGSPASSVFNYNAGAHSLTFDNASLTSSLQTEASFTNNTVGDQSLKLLAGQTQIVRYGNDNFEITNNTGNEQSILYAYSGGNITVNDAEVASSLTITKYVADAGQTALNAGDIYTTFANGQTKDFSISNRYFEVDNTSGARTAVLRRTANDLTQIAGTGVNDTFLGNESFETLSNTNDYYLEMTGGEEQYIKLGTYAYKMNNTTGTTKTDVFRQSGSTLISQNSSITDTNIPIANQDDFNQLMPVLDWSIGIISDKRSTIGNKIAALNKTMDLNMSNGINLTAANSVIRDADIAKTQSNYVKESILRDFSTNLFKQMKDVSGQLAITLLVH